jgi:hypothetical protein
VAYDERNSEVFYPPPFGLQYRGAIYSEAKQFLHASCDLLYQVTQPAMSGVVLVTWVPWETDRHSGNFHGKGENSSSNLFALRHTSFSGAATRQSRDALAESQPQRRMQSRARKSNDV